MKAYIETYIDIEKSTLYMIGGAFCLQLLNAALLLILNLYMTQQGYSDHQIADCNAYRFLMVMVLGLFFGMYIKGKNLKPLFLLAATCLPLVSWGLIQAIYYHNSLIIKILLLTWGFLWSCRDITAVPYILRNTPPKQHIAAIALNASTWGVSQIVAGGLIFILSKINGTVFTEKFLLEIFCFIGLLSVFFVYKMPNYEPHLEPKTAEQSFKDFYNYDWIPVLKAVVPSIIIAIGAGLAVPFMNLFFYHVFGLGSSEFALLGGITAFLVAICSLVVPYIQKNTGYKAIIYSQLWAIVALVVLGISSFWGTYSFAFYMAVVAYLMRQPLMNLAAPLTSQITMYYVGKKNREMSSALHSAMWSGSWFISSKFFAIMRAQGMQYGTIFFTTAVFYVFGVLCYQWLLNDFEQKKSKGLIQID